MRSLEIYEVLEPLNTAAIPAFAFDAPYGAATPAPEVLLNAIELYEIEQELALLIGPLATILVKKALPHATTAYGLRSLLAATITDAGAHCAFLNG